LIHNCNYFRKQIYHYFLWLHLDLCNVELLLNNLPSGVKAISPRGVSVLTSQQMLV